MMRRSLFLLAAVLLVLAVVAQAGRHFPSSRVSVYERTSVPTGWERLEQAAPTATVKFTLVVKGQNADKLEKLFWERSDPDHADYAQWLTNKEIEALVKPSDDDVRVLYANLASHGIAAESVVSHGDSYDVKTTVAAASSLFQTSFFRFRHTKSGYVALRQWGEYSVPSSLSAQLQLVLGVHTFPTLEQRMQMSAARRAHVRKPQQDAVTPAWVPKAVSKIYGVPFPIAPLSTPQVNAGVIEWVEQTFSADDLANFSVNTATPLSPVDAHRIVGNNSEAPAGIEAELDIQWIEGINPGFTPWFWLVSDPEQWLYTFTVEFLNAFDYPSIISLSYGLPEFLQCSVFSPSDCNGVDYRQYIQIVDKQWMKIGLIGVSVITATQDRGVYLTGRVGDDIERFTPEYPGSSAYVTSCGATEYANPVFDLPDPPPACNSTEWQCISGGSNEQSVSLAISYFLSSGGFSDVDLTPAYQQAAVAGYFASGVKLPNATLYNASGRGSPDVAAIGYDGYIIDDGEPGLVSGASMSTPIFAAIIALVQNDFYAIANTTLGFLNPLLYKGQMSGAGLFTDIIIGDNCGSEKCVAQQDGFLATKGWDPVSGLGSPLYPGMQKYVQMMAKRVVERRQ